MNKISLIIQREYLTRVRKKSFIIMTILGPVLMACIWIVPFFLATVTEDIKLISVVDETGIFYGQFENSDNIKFTYSTDLELAKKELTDKKYSSILYIQKPTYAIPTEATLIYSEDQPGIGTQSEINSAMNDILRKASLTSKYKITDEDLELYKKTAINLRSLDLSTGKKSYTEIKTGLGFISGFLIYMFIFIFGAQVMRGVIEEKSSRIVEIIISSVKPFQLMMGKIVGIALVGLTQFLLWIILTFGIVTVIKANFPDKFQTPKTEQAFTNNQKVPDIQSLQQAKNENISELIQGLFAVNYFQVITMFIFYFLGGYLLYASLFASIGAAVDNEADTQQFMLPITVPLILAFVVAQFVIQNPSGPVAFWFSIIPFTSPIIMMVRIPFGVPAFEVILSMVLLILGFIGTTWMAGKIYRTGILMYGKKVSYAELWKWLRYKH